MTITIPGLLLGILVGLAVTALAAYLWPPGKLRLLRPLVSAGIGVGVAYLVMTLIK